MCVGHHVVAYTVHRLLRLAICVQLARSRWSSLWPLSGQIGRSWLVTRKLYLRYDEGETWTRTQQTKLTTLLDKPLELELGVAAQFG